MTAFKIKGDYITLQQLLKIEGAISTGGEVKMYLASNKILVNGELEERRGRKLYPGDVVKIGFEEYKME